MHLLDELFVKDKKNKKRSINYKAICHVARVLMRVDIKHDMNSEIKVSNYIYHIVIYTTSNDVFYIFTRGDWKEILLNLLH